jgi:MFS family permease
MDLIMIVKQRKGWATWLLSLGRPIVLLLLVQLLSGIVLSPQGSFFPIYLEEQLGFTAVFVSVSVAVGRLLGMISAIVGGALSDALGHKWALILGLVGFVLGSLIFLVRAPWLVIPLWAASGMAMGFHSLGGQGYLIEKTASHHLGVISALYHWGFTLGGALSSPGAGAILDHWGFEPFGLTLLVIAVATVLCAIVFLPQLPRDSGQKRASWSQLLLGYREILRRPVIVRLGLLRFLPTCYYGMATVLNPLLINRAADSKTAVALYATLSLILATLGQMLVGQAADRWGRRGPTLATFGVLIFAIVGQAGFARHLWSFYTFGVLGICAAWSLSTLMPLLVSDATRAEERGRVLGMLHLLWSIAMMAGSLLGGALLELSVGLPFFVTALLNLGAIYLAVTFFRLVTPYRSLAETTPQLVDKS